MNSSIDEDVCIRCGDPIELTPIWTSRKFCGPNCRTIYRNTKLKEAYIPKEEVECWLATCNRDGCDIIFKKNRHNQIYCSPECSLEAGEQKKKEARRLTTFEIFRHDGFRCQYCGRTPADGIKLVVEHIYPISKGGKSDRFNLTTACSECNLSKSVKLLSTEEIIKRWDSNKEFFTYEDTMLRWKKIQTAREERCHE